MPLLASEAAKLSTDMLARGVIETIIEESPLFDRLPFLTVEGNSFKYNQENTLGGADFYAVNATWTEAPATFTQKTANLAILGGDADVDNFLLRSRSNLNDQRAIQTALKAKSVARKFEDTVIVGDTTVDSNAFDGLRVLCSAAQTLEVGATGGALTLALVDQLIDLVKGGKPDILLMSKRTRRKLKALLSASAHYVESGMDAFGRQVMAYDGIPVLVSDFQPDTETGSGGGSNLSSMYAIHFGETDGLVGLQNGGIEVVDVGQLEAKDASRVRIRWYCGLAAMRDSAIARLRSINNS
jgi:HK97 family phage major capsid protein